MPSAVTFTLTVDAAKAEAMLKHFEGVASDVSKSVQEGFSKRLTQAISVAAIEEAVRRTAEWANEITQTSKALGITAEQLQTLNIIASRSGTAQDAVATMYDNIRKAANAALSGNSEMINSFIALGVHIDRNEKIINIFGDTMEKIAKLQGGLINNPNLMIRNAAQNLIGQPANIVQGFAQQLHQAPGATIDDKIKNMAPDIASNDDIQQLTTVWNEILTTLKETGKTLLPVVTFVLNIVLDLVKALGGAADVVGDLVQAVAGIFTGNTKKLEQGLKNLFITIENAILGLVGLVPQLLDMITNALLGIIGAIADLTKHVPGMGKISKDVQQLIQRAQSQGSPLSEFYQKHVVTPFNKTMGASEGQAARGQALGRWLPAIFSAAEDAITAGAKAGSKIASKVGAEDTAAKLAKWVEKRTAETEPAPGVKVGEGEAPKEKVPEHMAKVRKALGLDEEGPINEEAIAKAAKISGLPKALIAAMTGLLAQQSPKNKSLIPGSIGEIPNPPLNPLLPSVKSGGPNVAIGGMFGAGETRIIRLTEQMLRLLGVIATNTSPYRPIPVGTSQGGTMHGVGGQAGGS